jgi:hypothetical protein
MLVRFTLVGAVALVLAAPLAEARPTALQLGFYNCFSKSYPITYQGTVQLQPAGRYGWGYLNTAARTLKNGRSGAYRVSGTRITWSGGPLGQLYGVVVAPTKFQIWAPGEKWSSYTCYFKF